MDPLMRKARHALQHAFERAKPPVSSLCATDCRCHLAV